MKSKIKNFFVILFAFFLFIVILSLLNWFKAENNKKLNILHKTPSYRIKGINKLDLSVKAKDGRPKAEAAQLSRKPLKDIFNIPHKKYEKYGRLFISHSKLQKNGATGYAVQNVTDFMNPNSNFDNEGNLSNIVNNLKFKGFSGKNKRAVALIFTGGNTALIKINGKKHYVHTGENIGGVFILKIEPSKIIYSSKGKILYKYLSD
jgi:hypothetical protein